MDVFKYLVCIWLTGSPRFMDGPGTREYVTVHRNFSRIVMALDDDVSPIRLARKLHEKDLVNGYMLTKAQLRKVPSLHRFQDLIEAVQQKIGRDASLYQTFIQVLQDTTPALADSLTDFYGTSILLKAI